MDARFLISVFCFFVTTDDFVNCATGSNCIRFRDRPGELYAQHNPTSSFAFTISENCREKINLLTIYYSTSSKKSAYYCHFQNMESPCVGKNSVTYCSCKVTDNGNEYMIKKHVPEHTGIRWSITGKSSFNQEFEEEYVPVKDPPTTENLQINSKHVEATVSSTSRASPGSSLFTGTSSYHPLSIETFISSDVQTTVGGNPKQIYATTPSVVDKASKDVSHTRVVLYSSIGGGGFLLLIISIVFVILFLRKAKRKSLESAQEAEAEALRMRPLPPTPPESRRESKLSTSSDVYQEIKDSDGSESPDDPVDYFHPVASEFNERKCRTNKMGVESRTRDLAPIRPVRKLGPGIPKFHRLCIPPASLPPDMIKDLDLGLAQRREAASHIGPFEGLSSEEGAVGGVSLDNVQPLFYASRSCIFPTLPLPEESDRFNDHSRRAHSRRHLVAKSDFQTQANQAFGKRRKIRSRDRDGRRSSMRSKRTVPYPLCLKEDDLDDIPPLPQRAQPMLETFDCRAQSSVLPELEVSARKSNSSNGLEREPMLLSIPEVTSSTDSDGYMKPRPAAKLAIPGNASVDAAMPQDPHSLPVGIISAPTTRIKHFRPKQLKATQDTATGKAPLFPMTMAASASTILASSQPKTSQTNSDYQNLQPSASCTSCRPAPQTGRKDHNGGYMCMDKSRGAAKKNSVD